MRNRRKISECDKIKKGCKTNQFRVVFEISTDSTLKESSVISGISMILVWLIWVDHHDSNCYFSYLIT